MTAVKGRSRAPGRWKALCAGALALLLTAPLRAAAQEPEPDPPTDTLVARDRVSPPLDPYHWAVEAAWRLEALGLVSGFLPAQRAAPRAAVARALREAAERAPVEAPELAGLAAGLARRFAEEFPDDAPKRRLAGGAALLGSSAGTGYVSRAGYLNPAVGSFDRREYPVPQPGQDDPFLAASVAASLGGAVAAVADARLLPDGVDPVRWDVAAGWGAVGLSVGRWPVGYGQAAGGGLILSGAAALERLELQTTRPVTLPAFLRWLGPTSFNTFVTRLDEDRHPGDPYFWGMRGAIRPHPRLTVAINRAAMFGGDSISTPVTAGNVARMFIGILSKDFENQAVSAEFRYRVPVEQVLPLTLYLEWGAEDASGAWWTVPGILAGALVPAVPGAPNVALGAEYTTFSVHCCGNPPWYFHGAFPGGWVKDDVPLGHPLGGEGRELLGFGRADLLDARLRLRGRAFLRERRDEGYWNMPQRAGNLFSPTRTGRSAGGAVDLAWRLSPYSELRLAAAREAGDGWAQRELRGSVTLLF
jgi:hypothetical protein